MKNLLQTLAATLLLCSCTQALTPQQQHAADVFTCRVHALSPYVGQALDVEELVREALQGKVDPGAVLAGLGVLPETIQSAKQAWQACVPAPAPVALSGS